MHGVQVTNMHDNQIFDSAVIKVEHTVGEPVTTIIDNGFVNTPEIAVVELNSDKTNTAILTGNAYSTRRDLP